MQRTLQLAIQLLILLAVANTAAAAFRAQDASPSQTTRRVATGLVQDSDGAMKPLPSGAEVRRWAEESLARELADAEVSRDFVGAAKRIGALRGRASWKEVPQREELLTRIAMVRAQLYQRVGDSATALRVLQVLLPGDLGDSDLQTVAADSEDLRLQTEALQAPAVRALREQLQSAAAAPPAVDDAIASAVGEAVANGKEGSILELGRRAVPALLRLASIGTDAWIDQGRDPLYYLVALDEARSAQLILEHFDRGGPFWKRRALRAMAAAQVLENEGTFLSQPRSNPRLIETWWLPVVLRLVQDPDTAQESLAFVRSLALRDALDEPLIAALSQLLRGSDPGLIGAIQKIIGQSRGHDGTRRILESMLDAHDPLLRDFAAQNLLSYRESPGLRAAVRSGDPKVRLAVVKSLQDHYVAIPQYGLDGSPGAAHQEQVSFGLDAADAALLEVLLRDADLQVRLEAVDAVRQKQAAIADATWLELARSPDAEVRRGVAYAAVPDLRRDDLSARVLEILAQDKDPQVLDAFDAVIAMHSHPSDKDVDLDKFLPAIEMRVANVARPFRITEEGMRDSFTRRVLETEAGRRTAGRWALSGNTEWADMLAVQISTALSRAMTGGAAPGSVQPAAVNIPFDDAGLIRFLRGGWTGGNAWYRDVAQQASRLRVEHPEPWRALALDTSAPVPLRLAAVDVIADRADAELARVLVDVLTSATWSSQDDRGWEGMVRSVFLRLPREFARQAFAALLEKGGNSFLIRGAAVGFASAHEFTPALSETYLQRVLGKPDGPYHQEAALAALNEVASRPAEKRGTWLEQAVRFRPLAAPVVRLLGGLREARYRPLLVEALDARWITDESERDEVQVTAIEAIARYLDDEAVQILLDTAGSFSDSSLRQVCYDELNRIKSHLAAKAEWELRRRAGASKDSAIAALLPMLDSEDAAMRAQAARSLATLGAVEELPRLVKLLQDPDAVVREAAQRALEVLNDSTARPR